jgi:hypothetical protein
MIGPGDLVMKTNATEITAEELNLIKDYCTNVGMYNLKLLLKTNFKGSDYSNELLHNVVQREKAKKIKQANPLQDLLIMVRI